MFDERKFRAQLILVGLTMKDLASELDMNESTLYRKIKANGAFTRDEINRMIVVMRIQNPMDIFFTDKLAETQV